MPIEFVSGDLFENAYEASAFAHGCNCQGSMGAGIAKDFRERYPAMFEEFRARCKATPREFNLGDVWLWKAEDQPWVFNLGTQEGVWHARASYEAIETALRRMQELADAEAIHAIAMPRIGVGYGGLSWKKVRAIIEHVFAAWSGRLIVYEQFIPSAAATSDARQERASKLRTKMAKDQVSFRWRALTIACTDLEKSVQFYENVLGATVIPRDVGTCRWYRLGDLELTLLPNAERKCPAKFPTHAMTILWLEVDDLAAAAARFSKHDVKIVDKGDGQFLMIADPDGLLIEVWETVSAGS